MSNKCQVAGVKCPSSSAVLVFANQPKADEAISDFASPAQAWTTAPKRALGALGSTFVVLLLIGLVVNASAESAFSALGYGLLRDDSNARSTAMGLASAAAPDTLSIDLHNPAVWQGSQMTRFGLSAAVISSTTEDALGSDGSDQTEFNGAALVLPIGRSQFVGVAISPYTRMKYLWNSQSPAAQDWTTIAATQEGDGGLSQGLVGFSTPITSTLRLGLAARGLFGKNESYWLVTFPNADALSTSRTVSDRYRGVGLTVSGYWRFRESWAAGVFVNSPVKMKIEQRAIIREGYSILDDFKGVLGVKYETPWDVTVGAARLFNRQLVTAEAAWHGWSGVKEPQSLAVGFRDAWRISSGWEWIPEFRAFDPWWEALTYRAGVYWQNHYVVSYSDHQAATFALTGGLGIPYFNDQSRFDIGFQYGWRGSKDKDGAAERFFLLSVSLNHKEQWFVGRKERH